MRTNNHKRPPLSVEEHRRFADTCLKISAQLEEMVKLLEHRKGCGVRNLDKLIKMDGILLMFRANLSDIMYTDHYGDIPTGSSHRLYFPNGK